MNIFRRLFGPSARELLDLAIMRAARAKGELEAAGMRVRFYAVLIADMDPELDWWRYAEVRQKLQDARDDHLALFHMTIKAESEVKALIADGVAQ